MILKIARYVDKEDWVIFDNIRKVSKVNLKVSDFLGEPSEWNADVLVVDYHNQRMNDVNPADIDCILLRCRAKIGEDEGFSIAFDTLAYLCNDLGQTIEKIVANYRP